MLFWVQMLDDPHVMFWLLLLNMIFYMPTIALAITLAYNALKRDGHDVVSNYPPIRVWGTIGFIAALWTTSLLHMETTSGQFYVASAASLVLGLYAFTLPPAPPRMGHGESRALVDVLGLTSFRLFKDRTSTRLTSSHSCASRS